VSDDELTHLASERSLTIKGAILANGPIDPKRVFITEAKNLEPEKEGKAIDFGSGIMTLQ
ncbi:MAG: hypothetical protein GY705_07675, partial [Bacteroidetes bacterium]|nr:hypothetical protein [Bacteroidota bacterium]